MRTLWVVILGVVALTAIPGCKRRVPESIPGPKAGSAVVGHVRTPGIAWFQGSFDEAFARTALHRPVPQNGLSCVGVHPVAPRATS